MKLGMLALLALTACGKDAAAPPSETSCADRTAALSTRLAASRPLAEIRASASPATQALLDELAADPDEATIAAHAAMLLQPLVAPCPPLLSVFAEVASVEGDKDAYLRSRVPAAIEACACKASPEDVGALLEVILGGWAR